MKIQITSDLHTEFYGYDFSDLLDTFDPTDVDVLVVAGDVGTLRYCSMQDSLAILSRKYPHVVFVTGNHEYYNTSKPYVDDVLQDVCKKYGNLHWLDHSVVEIGGQRFIGSTLWFRDHPMNELYARGLNDFRVIRGFRNWVYKENEKAITYLSENIREGDFVVTHHLPSQLCVDPRFKGSNLNRFFVCEMDDVIERCRPKHWVAGHTHHSCRVNVHDTLITINPYGYPGALNPQYVKKLIIEV